MTDEPAPDEKVDLDGRAYDALSRHARIADLAAITRKTLSGAAAARRPEGRPEEVARLAEQVHLSRETAATDFGNVLDVLGYGPSDEAGRALARALAAHALASAPPKDVADRRRAAAEILWAATHTPFDPTGLVDRALGDGAAGMWEAMALAAVLGLRRDAHPAETLAGELTAAPRGLAATVLLAVTGVLLVCRALRLLGTFVLAFKRPAEVAMSADGGVRVKWRVELLGRTLRERDVVVPRGALVRVVREVRYPRFAFYLGLLALTVGSYAGVSSVVDGVRAASPSLLAWGLAIVAVGVGLDFALSSLAPGVRGHCRMIFVPRRGANLCIGGVDFARADGFLARLEQS